MTAAERAQDLELVDANAEGFDFDPSHAWCRWCSKPLWRDNTSRLVCADRCADAIDGSRTNVGR